MINRIGSWILVMALGAVLALASAPLAAPAAAQSGDPAAPPRVTDDILDIFIEEFETELAYYGIPGGALAVVQAGEIVRTEAFGVRDVETGAPFTVETRFRIGSTTKSMTALIIAQLVDEGLLTWDTPVVEILPDFAMPTPELTAQTRVRDLMGMATGLASDPLAALYWGDWSVDDLLAAVAEQTVAGAFGSAYNYNNEVYAVAGYVAAQAASGDASLDAYRRLLRTRIFAPIGMESTLLTDDERELGDNFTTSYGLAFLEWPLVLYPYSPNAPIGVVGPAGAVWSTVGDMARYVITHLNAGVTPDGLFLVTPKNLAVTWKPGVTVPSGDALPIESMAYGMGWLDMVYAGHRVRYHDGSWNGHSTHMVTFPDDGIGLIIYTNHELGTALFNTHMMARFAEMLYELDPAAQAFFHEQYEIFSTSTPEQIATLPAPEVDPAAVAPLLGTYERGWVLSVDDANILTLTRPGWVVKLRPLGRDDLYVPVAGITGATMAITAEAITLYMPTGPEVFARVE